MENATRHCAHCGQVIESWQIATWEESCLGKSRLWAFWHETCANTVVHPNLLIVASRYPRGF